MPATFSSFIAELEQVQGHPLALVDMRSFTCLFDDDFVVETTLADDGRFLVTDVWVGPTGDIPHQQHALLMTILLEINGYAGMMHGAACSLDEESRIVLSHAQPLAQLSAALYLANLHNMLEQARQLRKMILTIYPVITIMQDADSALPDQA